MLGYDQVSGLRGGDFRVLDPKMGLGPCGAQHGAEQVHAGASSAPPPKSHQLRRAVKQVELILGQAEQKGSFDLKSIRIARGTYLQGTEGLD